MKKLLMFLFAILFLIGIAGFANATPITITIGDDYNYWPTWGNGQDDGSDVIGQPDIYSMEITTANGLLSTIKINMASNPGGYGGSGLFIDNNGDLNWDYYADDGTLYQVSGTVGLFDHEDEYIMSSLPYLGNYRQDHPVGIKSDYLEDYNSGGTSIGYGYSSETLTYDFSNYNTINITGDPGPDNWTIGYTVGCANDAFLTPVPEPATMLLLGTGLIGLAFLGRKKLFKK